MPTPDIACTLPPLGLYIHIPWCIRKCPYCDFNSHSLDLASPDFEQAYLEALLLDLEYEARRHPQKELASVFIGGGTPSVMSPEFYHRLLDEIEQYYPLPPTTEITLEANPGTLDEKKFAGYRRAGINRISLGIQSFNHRHLKKLGRIHDAGQAMSAIEQLKSSGFDNFNIDLMHGLPEQTPEQAMSDLDTALGFEPPHLSWYQLTIEPNTVFYHQPPPLPKDDTLWDIQQQGEARLASAGLEHYEVSAWACPGRRSRHNLNYWQFGDYIGIGAGAHGKRSECDARNHLAITRYSKTRQPDAYLKRIGNYIAKETLIKAEELPFEFMMNALRLKNGVHTDLFSQRTGLPATVLEKGLTRGRQKGLLRTNRLACTETGFHFLNETLGLFMD
ncbi:MAG: YggW family oxidoreductase [Proteobacteria bacterium]|nr:MAG: YggW family oxidoreductase [Pseudomonadota bacterium]